MIGVSELALELAVLDTQRDRRAAILEKILAKCIVEDRGYSTPCWIYTGGDSGSGRGGGYPRFKFDGGTLAVHIAMWVNFNGIIPPRKQLDHLCRQRMCIRPSHNELVTHKTNQRRRDAARRTVIVPEGCESDCNGNLVSY